MFRNGEKLRESVLLESILKSHTFEIQAVKSIQVNFKSACVFCQSKEPAAPTSLNSIPRARAQDQNDSVTNTNYKLGLRHNFRKSSTT